MRPLLAKSTLVSIGLMLLLLPTSAEENVPTCGFEGDRFICATGSDDSERILLAMANPASSNLLHQRRLERRFFETPQSREGFLRSLEANRKAMHQFANEQLRKRRRRKIDDETYEEIRKKFAAGMLTYKAGFLLYRTAIWFDKNPPTQAD